MRVINLILHILSMIVMIPDLLFVGIAFLWGMQYLRGLEMIFVPLFVLVLFAGFFYSFFGGIIQFPKYRKASNYEYMKHELKVHGLAAAGFGEMIIYTIRLILHPTPKIPELTTESHPSVSLIDLTGFALAIAGILISLIVGIRKDKQPNSNNQMISHPRFCPYCGASTEESGNFCVYCGAKMM